MLNTTLHLDPTLPNRVPDPPGSLVFTQAKSYTDEELKLSQANQDLVRLEEIQATINQIDDTDAQALQMAEVALECLGSTYLPAQAANAVDASLEAESSVSVRERVVAKAKQILKAIIDFTIKAVTRLYEYGKVLLKTSDARRRLLKKRCEAIEQKLKEKGLVLTPTAIKPEQVSLVANGRGLQTNNQAFMNDMRDSIRTFLGSPNLRLAREIFKIQSDISQDQPADRDRFVLQRLEKMRQFEWIKSDKALDRQTTPLSGLQVGHLRFITKLPKDQLVVLYEIPEITEASLRSLSWMGYQLRERTFDKTRLEKAYYDETDPAVLLKEVEAIDNLIDSLSDLINHIKVEQPSLERSRRELTKMQQLFNTVGLNTDDSIKNVKVFNVVLDNLVSFPTQLFYELMQFVTAYVSLLSAHTGVR